MDDKLIARRDEAEHSFNELTKQKEQIDAELLRLQGEYRLINNLLNKKANKSKVSPEPNVVDVDAAVKE